MPNPVLVLGRQKGVKQGLLAERSHGQSGEEERRHTQ